MACSRIANHQLAIRGNSVQHKNTIFHRIETLFSVLFSRRFQVTPYMLCALSSAMSITYLASVTQVGG
jgi:hypothetical protein